MTQTARERQGEVFRLYSALVGECEDWAGALVLSCGEGSAASGVATAVSIAGGAALVLDPDSGAVKAAMRRGELDFVVNTLDEALRALKNEVRQKRPLSVGLTAEVTSTLTEIVERGVLPALLMVGEQQRAEQMLQNESIRTLEGWGMRLRLMTDRTYEAQRAMFDGKVYDGHFFAAVDAEELRRIDERLLGSLQARDVVRRRWLQTVPKYLREARAEGRWFWLSEEEAEAFASL